MSASLRVRLASTAAIGIAVAALVTWQLAPALSAQAPGATVWDGVFSMAQAKRGEAAYTSYCVRCHGVDLSGGGRQGRQLKGDSFLQTWQANSLQSLFAKIQATMPRDDPSTLADAVYLDVMAFILEANGFPAGTAELQTTRARLDTIRIERQKGSNEVANFSLVDVIGCLTQRDDSRWVLTNATTPVATSSEGPAAAGEPVASQPGAATLRLIGVARFDPQAHRGQTMRAKGLIDKTSSDARLDLTSLQPVAPTCAN